MKSYLIIIFLTIFSLDTFGQDRLFMTTNHYLPLGIGMSFYQSKDAFNSPNRHRGLTTKFLIGYESFSPEQIHRENLFFQSGGLSNGTKNGKKLNLNRTNYQGEIVTRNQPVNIVPVDLENTFSYFLGLSLKVNFSTRSGGKLFQFDGNATLNLTGAATYNYYDFQVNGERWFYDGSINLPLIGVGFRPRYASHSYIGDIPSYKQNTIGFIYFPKHFEIDARANANWDMGTGNLLRGCYRWRFYDTRLVHRVRTLENEINFSLLTKLN